MARDIEKNDQLRIGDPRFCDIVVSTRCVLQCKMCKAWQCGQDPASLTFENAKKFVRSLSEFVSYPLEINVMGGEPLLKEWCLDLCSFIHEQGFKSIISTNAYLIDEDMAKRIADSRLNVLAISLESLRPETHDFYRGVKGTFSKVMKAIEYLDKYCRGRLALTILTIIMEKNLDELPELVEWVQGNDLFENVSFLALLETGIVHPRNNWFKRPEYSEMWPQNVKRTHRCIDELIRLRKKGYKIWNPLSQLEAFKSYYVDPDKFMRETEYRIHDYIIDLDEHGTVYLSGEPLGDITKDDVKDLWYSGKAQQIRKAIDVRGPGKRCCVINFICAFPPDSTHGQKQRVQSGQVNLEQGFLYYEQRQFTEAIQAFTAVLRVNPNSENAHHGLGLCYQEEGSFDRAIEEYNKILELNPHSDQAYQDLGFSYFEQRQIKEAIQAFTAALKMNPKNEHAHHGLGLCYQYNKEFKKAICAFEEALRINPQNEHVHQSVGYYYKDQKEYDRAVAAFRRVLEINPQSPQASLGFGFCYYDQGFIKKAAHEFEAVLKKDPRNEHAHHGLGSCFQSTKQYEKAIKEFALAIEINPRNEYAHQGMAYSYEALGQFERAIAEFTEALKVSPQNELYHHGIGCCFEGLRLFDKAAEKYKQVLEINPQNEYAVRCLASCTKSLQRQDGRS